MGKPQKAFWRRALPDLFGGMGAVAGHLGKFAWAGVSMVVMGLLRAAFARLPKTWDAPLNIMAAAGSAALWVLMAVAVVNVTDRKSTRLNSSH